MQIDRCPEYDTFEGNSETMSVAVHTCDYTPPNEYPQCDRVSLVFLNLSVIEIVPKRPFENKFVHFYFFLPVLSLLTPFMTGKNHTLRHK